MAAPFTGSFLSKHYPSLALIETRLGITLTAFSIPMCSHEIFSSEMLMLRGYTPNGSYVTYETPYCRARMEFPELFS